MAWPWQRCGADAIAPRRGGAGHGAPAGRHSRPPQAAHLPSREQGSPCTLRPRPPSRHARQTSHCGALCARAFRAAASGAAHPRELRHRAHRCRCGRARAASGAFAWRQHVDDDRLPRYRHGDSPRSTYLPVRAAHAGRRVGHAPLRRHRLRIRPQQLPHGPEGDSRTVGESPAGGNGFGWAAPSHAARRRTSGSPGAARGAADTPAT